jgi:DNA replicative helicase MCM subunit Mcm2 (Cdc46/Mcm family)
VCGNTTTTAGLTVAVSKEGKGGDVAIEAGALVSVSVYNRTKWIKVE